MSSSIANKLSRNPHMTDNEIVALLTELQGFREKITISAESTLYIPFANETRIREDSHTIRASIGSLSANVENRIREATRTGTTMIRRISDPVTSYPLIHTTTNGPFSFIKGPDTKYGGGIIFDGTNYISIADHSRLNVSDEITIAGMLTLPAYGGSITRIVMKEFQYAIDIRTGNTLNAFVRIGGSWGVGASIPYTPNVPFSFVMTYKSTSSNLKLYKDQNAAVTETRTGAMATGSSPLGIGHKGDASGIVLNNTKIGWIVMLHKEVAAQWATDFNNGIIDTDGNNEITTIPFIESTEPQPEASFGIAA